MLPVKIASAMRRPLQNSFQLAHIVRMRSLQDQIGRRFRPCRVSIYPRRFIGPIYPLGAHIYSYTSHAPESLCFGEMRFVSAKLRNYEPEALLPIGEGMVCRLQFLALAREFFLQMLQSQIGGGIKTLVGRS
jgi:hypothetical protein